MQNRPFLVVFALCLGSATAALADAPVTLNVPAQTPLTTALANLATNTGATILTDSTVTAQVGPADLHAPNVGAMLTKLQSLDSGLVWHKVYLPANAPVPTGETLSPEVRALEAISATGLVIASPTDTISVTRRADTSASAPAGMQAVYLVTDETARAQQAQAAAAPAASPVDQAASGMKDVANVFSQMTPDQQKAALPLMFQQFQRILQVMDPTVRAGLGQMFQQAQGGMMGNGQ